MNTYIPLLTIFTVTFIES